MAKLTIGDDDLIENPTPRVPVVLCLDTSGSMDGAPIRELVRGIAEFIAAIDADEDAHDAAEVAVVEFNSRATLVHEFSSVDNFQSIASLRALGGTAMGEGVNLALDVLEARKGTYSDNGVLYYQPWLVLMTDGAPNGNHVQLERAIERVTAAIADRKLTIFPIGIGEAADMDMLARFSPNKPPLRLQGLNFKEFFQWLSKSVSKVSQSSPGDAPPKLDLQGLAGWADL